MSFQGKPQCRMCGQSQSLTSEHWRRRSRYLITDHTPPTVRGSGHPLLIRKHSGKQPVTSESQSLEGLIYPAAMQAKDTSSIHVLTLAELWLKRVIWSFSTMLSLLLLRYFIETETLAVSGAINSSPLVTSPTSPETHKVSITAIQKNSCKPGQIDRDNRSARTE